MLTTLQNSDVEVDLANIDKSIIINSITLQDVKFFLESLGVSQIYLNEDKEYLVCPTICHNPLNEAQSMKLYWYQNHKIFRCYTECNESMSIFKLYQKFMDINYHSVSEEEAENYVKNCLKHIIFQQPQFISSDNLDLIKYQYTDNIPLAVDAEQVNVGNDTLTNKLNVLNTRIDSLAHLDEGSTTGDAELIDGRIDNNGVIYN